MLHAHGIGRTAVSHRTGFSHAIALPDSAFDSLHAFARKVSSQRSSARKNHSQTRQVIVVDRRIFRQLENDWRHDVRERHAIFLNRLEKLLQIEARHKHNRRS